MPWFLGHGNVLFVVVKVVQVVVLVGASTPGNSQAPQSQLFRGTDWFRRVVHLLLPLVPTPSHTHVAALPA